MQRKHDPLTGNCFTHSQVLQCVCSPGDSEACEPLRTGWDVSLDRSWLLLSPRMRPDGVFCLNKSSLVNENSRTAPGMRMLCRLCCFLTALCFSAHVVASTSRSDTNSRLPTRTRVLPARDRPGLMTNFSVLRLLNTEHLMAHSKINYHFQVIVLELIN